MSDRGQGRCVIEAIFQAREYRPDGIVAATDFGDVIGVDETASAISYPYGGLNRVLPDQAIRINSGGSR